MAAGAELDGRGAPARGARGRRAARDTDFGIEWVSEEDRERYGGLLPAPDPHGQLRLLTGAGSDPQGRPLILVLDHETYRFASRARNSKDPTTCTMPKSSCDAT